MKKIKKMPNTLPKSNSNSDDETEFVKTEESIPIVKTKSNLKGRLAGLAKAREVKTKQQNAIKKVTEVTAKINRAQRLQEQATTALNEGRTKAKEVGVDIPDTPSTESQLQKMLNDMRDEIKQLKSVAEVKKVEVKVPEPQPLPEPVPEPSKPEPPKKIRIYVKKKKEPEPEPVKEAYSIRPRANDERSRLEQLKLLMGRT